VVSEEAPKKPWPGECDQTLGKGSSDETPGKKRQSGRPNIALQAARAVPNPRIQEQM